MSMIDFPVGLGYVSGPMTGYPKFNFPEFDSFTGYARRRWPRATIVSPAEHDRQLDPALELWPGYEEGSLAVFAEHSRFSYEEAMAWDLKVCADADTIFMLPGWEQSSGAGHELYVARVTGTKVLYAVRQANGGWDVTEQDPNGILVLGLAGFAQVGKDSLGGYLVRKHGYERLAFADRLRDFAVALNPIIEVREHMENGRQYAIPSPMPLADAVAHWSWEFLKANDPKDTWGARQMLQRLGTEAGRKVLGDNVWVDATFDLMEAGGKYVITDVRFPNEAQAISDAGGQVWRIVRPGHGPQTGHESEDALADWPFTRTLHNNGSLSSLYNTASNILSDDLVRLEYA